VKSYWLTPTGAYWKRNPTTPGRYELSEQLHDIFDGSDSKGISNLDLVLHGYDWATVDGLMRFGLVTDKLEKSVWGKKND